MTCECLGTSGASTGTGTESVCGTYCTNGMARIITVTTSRPFTPTFPTSSFIPFNRISATTRTLVIRV
jgi:hypothetical protein